MQMREGVGTGVLVDAWAGCYRSGWQGLCVPEAFAHPAKYSRALIQRIYQHLTAEGWLRPGDTVLDCFAGVGLGGLDAGLAGVRWLGVELEPHFHALGQENIALWQRRYLHLPQWVTPTLVQGDSRKLQAVLAEQVGCCISSPPFCDSDNRKGGTDLYHLKRLQTGRDPESPSSQAYTQSDPYGTTPGQLGAMSPGQVEAVVSSPPYVASLHLNEPVEADIARMERKNTPLTGGATSRKNLPNQHANQGYGTSPGQLGAMPPGQVEACVSSPPYCHGLGKEHTYADHAKRERDSHRGIMREKGIVDPYYGSEPAQLGNMPASQLGTEHGMTFWAAAQEILAHVYALLRPGGMAVWVVKAYVRDGQIVDFPGDWRQLAESLGFVTLHEHHALLVEEHGTQGGLFGAEVQVTVARKSFFRRLAERNGSPAIDFEVVLCMQKLAGGAEGLSAAISSPPYIQSVHDGNGIDPAKLTGNRPGKHTQANAEGYGRTPGQLGSMPAGTPHT